MDLKTIANPARAAREAARRDGGDAWTTPVLTTAAQKGEGIPEVVSALDRHFRYLDAGGELPVRRRRRLREQVVEVAEDRLRRRLWSDRGVLEFVETALPRIERGELSPFGIADDLLAQGAPAIARTTP